MTKINESGPSHGASIEEAARRAASHDPAEYDYPSQLEGNASVRHEIGNEMAPLKDHMNKLKSAWEDAKATGNEALAKQLATEIRDVNQALNQVGREVASAGNLSPNDFVSQVTSPLKDIDLSVGRDLMAKVGKDSQGAAESLNAVTGADTAAAAQSTQEAESWAAGLLENPDQLVREFESNPEAFFAKVGDLSSEMRQGLMMKLQGEIQEDNQLFGMLTNFMKAMHDTEKAIIANLRV